jgi:preprotein translocase subunit SecG
MSRTTAILAGIFFVSTLALAYFGGPKSSAASSVLEGSALIVPAVPGAGQIPGSTTPAASGKDASVPSATVIPGAGQIPTK